VRRVRKVMAQLADAGKLTLDDVRELEKLVKRRARTLKSDRTRR